MQVAPEDVNQLYRSSNASVTVLVPPRESANGILHAYGKGDISASVIRDIVLVHTLQRRFLYDDLIQLPVDALVPTLLEGAVLQPSLAGGLIRSPGSGVGQIGFMHGDLDACADDSVMHTIHGILLPPGVQLPASAAARSIDESKRSSDSGGRIYFFIGAVVLLGLSVFSVIALLFVYRSVTRRAPSKPDPKLPTSDISARPANISKSGGSIESSSPSQPFTSTAFLEDHDSYLSYPAVTEQRNSYVLEPTPSQGGPVQQPEVTDDKTCSNAAFIDNHSGAQNSSVRSISPSSYQELRSTAFLYKTAFESVLEKYPTFDSGQSGGIDNIHHSGVSHTTVTKKFKRQKLCVITTAALRNLNTQRKDYTPNPCDSRILTRIPICREACGASSCRSCTHESW